MLLMLGIFSLAFGFLLAYCGFAGVSVRGEVGHIFNPASYPAPPKKNPQA